MTLSKARSRRVAVWSGVALVAGVATGATSFAIAADASSTPSPFKVNASGQTYGTIAQSVSPDAEPDLVLTVGDNGKTGYTYSRDLNSPDPKSPAEAAERSKQTGVVVVPVYDVDGKTQIDTFTMYPGEDPQE